MVRPMVPEDDLYARLELPIDASAEAIEIAWRSLLRRHHPDVAARRRCRRRRRAGADQAHQRRPRLAERPRAASPLRPRGTGPRIRSRSAASGRTSTAWATTTRDARRLASAETETPPCPRGRPAAPRPGVPGAREPPDHRRARPPVDGAAPADRLRRDHPARSCPPALSTEAASASRSRCHSSSHRVAGRTLHPRGAHRRRGGAGPGARSSTRTSPPRSAAARVTGSSARGRRHSTSHATAPTPPTSLELRERAAPPHARRGRRGSCALRRASARRTGHGRRRSMSRSTRASASRPRSPTTTSRPRRRSTGVEPATAARARNLLGADRPRQRAPARAGAGDRRAPCSRRAGGDAATPMAGDETGGGDERVGVRHGRGPRVRRQVG